MGQLDNPKSKPTDPYTGTKLGICLLTLSALLYYYIPLYFGPATLLVSTILAAIGIMGLGIDLSKTSTGKSLGLDDLGIGLGLSAFWLILYNLFNTWLSAMGWFSSIAWLLNVLISPILFLGLFGAVSGLFNIIYSLFARNLFRQDGEVSLARLFAFIVQVVALVAGVLQTLQILKLIG